MSEFTSEGGVSPKELSYNLDHISVSNAFQNNSYLSVVENYIAAEKCIRLKKKEKYPFLELNNIFKKNKKKNVSNVIDILFFLIYYNHN